MQSLCAAPYVRNAALKDQPAWLSRPWITLTSSRLGHDHELHREVCRYVARSMLDCRSRNAIAVIASGSAIQPWAERAAKLYGVDTIKVTTGDESNEPTIHLHNPPSGTGADELSIAVGDRVDAVYVRSSGRICQSLQQRISSFNNASVRIAMLNRKPTAAKKLIGTGAIGWHIKPSTESLTDHTTNQTPSLIDTTPMWSLTDGQWLVHCTRACQGPWPGQTQNQYRDALLLNGESQPKTALSTLERILRSSRLVGSAIATNKTWPVVCFSEAPLRELLQRRCFRPHLKRWDYEPYGVAIRKSAAITHGIAPVIYGEPAERIQFAPEKQHLFQATGKTFDWRQEREWRALGDVDLRSYAKEDVRVFVPTVEEAMQLRKHSYPIDVIDFRTSPKS